jgi:hypothetical protein
MFSRTATDRFVLVPEGLDIAVRTISDDDVTIGFLRGDGRARLLMRGFDARSEDLLVSGGPLGVRLE